jgi:hypothetical protein
MDAEKAVAERYQALRGVMGKKPPGELVRVRRKGAGRPPVEVAQPGLTETLESRVAPVTRGDPESPLSWTCKSTRALAADLEKQGYDVSPQKVGELLKSRGDNLQAVAKSLEGEFKNGGREWQPAGAPVLSLKAELQRLADATGLAISVSHFPPGTSKWNKVERRLFSHIRMNWSERPLEDYETVVNLIGSTTTSKGLKVKARLDRRRYRTGVSVSQAAMHQLHLIRSDFHGDWNYVLKPKPAK